MYIKRGRSRLVICVPRIGIVIKLPRTRLKGFIRHTAWAAKRSVEFRSWTFLGDALRLNEESDSDINIRYTLLNGVYQNWMEYLLWRKTHSRFLEPTYFSFLGLINVQRYGEPLAVSTETLWVQLWRLTERSIAVNPHHFHNPANFSLRKGKIRMVDYGGRNVADIVQKYGEEIAAAFEPNYIYKPRKIDGESAPGQ